MTNNIIKDLRGVIDTNSKFIRHIKDNIVILERRTRDFEIYYTGQQGWSEKLYGWNETNRRLHSGKGSAIFKNKDSVGKKYAEGKRRVYADFVEEIKSDLTFDLSIPVSLETRKVIENKLALLAIRFSKRFDNEFINNMCQVDSFNPAAITKLESGGNNKGNLRGFIKWVIDNTSKMKNIDKDKKYAKYDNKEAHGGFAVDASELFLIVNQPLMDEIRLKEVFKEIQLVNYFKELNIIDAELPNNFEAVLINKRALWFCYGITSVYDPLSDNVNVNPEEKNKIYLHIDYQLGLIPFVGACALIKA